ncbi:MAG TPA: hypothetical protein VFV58_12585 [Blastocatellia bacterium]|jgi:hypothetical protein|nr:hypothetical protein [Blastocatellia bacterium]
MTQGEMLIAEILLSVLRGQRTLVQLKRQLADGMAYVEERGVLVEKELLLALAAMDSAIRRIEAEKIKYTRIRDN